MPIHDWSRSGGWLFQDFRHGWICEISRALNRGVLPPDHYALIEPSAAGFGPELPDWLTVQVRDGGIEHYRRSPNSVAVRSASDDRLVSVVEVVSPAHKSTPHALEQFTRGAAALLGRHVHLFIIDLTPPSRYDPRGIHGAIWNDLNGRDYSPLPDKPLTLAAYESDVTVRAYVEPVAVGDALPDMPLFFGPGRYVEVPLEDSYRAAWEAVPRRWKGLLEGGSV
jgi:hypothetical protein